MIKILNWPRTVGPLLTVIATIIYHYGSTVFGYSIAVMPLAVFLALGSFTGVRAGLICALWISAYAWLTIPDTSRIVQISIGSLAIAIAIGLQARALRAALADSLAAHSLAEAALADARAAHIETEAAWAREREARLKAEEGEEAIKALDGLNGNIERILRARNKVRDMASLDELSDTMRAEMGSILHTLNNVLTAVQGWQEYAKLRERMGKEKIG